MYIDIPEGIDNNEIIIIKNKGNLYDGIFTDLKILVTLHDHKLFSRNGLDIIAYVNINFKESLIGFEKEIIHLNQKKYKIKNNTGEIVLSNTEKKFSNLGFIRNNYIGNLIIKFHIDYPNKLSDNIINDLKKIL